MKTDDNVVSFPKPWHRSPPAEARPPAVVVGMAKLRLGVTNPFADLQERCHRAAIKLGYLP